MILSVLPSSRNTCTSPPLDLLRLDCDPPRAADDWRLASRKYSSSLIPSVFRIASRTLVGFADASARICQVPLRLTPAGTMPFLESRTSGPVQPPRQSNIVIAVHFIRLLNIAALFPNQPASARHWPPSRYNPYRLNTSSKQQWMSRTVALSRVPGAVN